MQNWGKLGLVLPKKKKKTGGMLIRQGKKHQKSSVGGCHETRGKSGGAGLDKGKKDGGRTETTTRILQGDFQGGKELLRTISGREKTLRGVPGGAVGGHNSGLYGKLKRSLGARHGEGEKRCHASGGGCNSKGGDMEKFAERGGKGRATFSFTRKRKR